MRLAELSTTVSEAGRKVNRDIPELLLQLLRRVLSDEQCPVELPASPGEWFRLYSLAHRHGVLPLVCTAIKRIDSTSLPPDWRGAFRVNAAQNLHLTGELFKLLDELNRHDIPAIAFKGLTLAARIYGDVALREAGDVDLLISPDDIVRAVDLLIACSYRAIYPTATAAEQRYLFRIGGRRRAAYLRSHSEHHLVCQMRQVNVDLHWSITLREFGVRWDLEGMWKRATTFALAGRKVPCLGDGDLILVLCANGAKDGWERLDRICDVAAMLRHMTPIDREAAFAAARAAGITRMLTTGLWLARELFSSPLPESVEEGIQSDPATRRIGSRLLIHLKSEHWDPASRLRRASLYLQLRERWRDRSRCCLEHLRPGVGDWAALPLPSPLRFLHYPLRPLRLIGRYGIELFHRPPAAPSDAASGSRCVP